MSIFNIMRYIDSQRSGTKLSPFFGFAKSSQTQNQLSIKPIAQIRCSCYGTFICTHKFDNSYLLIHH